MSISYHLLAHIHSVLPTLMETHPDPDPIEVAVISDLNSSYGSKDYGSAVHSAISHLLANPPDLVLITGDMVAGQRAGLDHKGMWRAFHTDVLAPLQEAGIPVAASPGNHDASAYSAYQNERDIYNQNWLEWKPDLDFVDDSHYPYYYAFTVGETLFVSIDATRVGPLDDAQMEWLTRLPSAEHSVVFGHMPLYPFAHGREREYLGSVALETLWQNAGVDLYVSGHHHSYYPGHRDGLGLVSMACLGSGSRPLIGTRERSAKALLRFQVGPDGIEGLEALQAPDFTTPIARTDLPPSIGTGSLEIIRDDLVLDPLADCSADRSNETCTRAALNTTQSPVLSAGR